MLMAITDASGKITVPQSNLLGAVWPDSINLQKRYFNDIQVMPQI
jgi:hypothetical protein